jgi:cupin fold WbuC family metalloprotein
MNIINNQLLNTVSAQAKVSPRLRMNYNFHQSLDEKCHRFLNAMEPGTVVPIHHHPTKDETFIVLRGKVKVSTFNDDGTLSENIVLSHEDGCYGVDIPKNVWHTIESQRAGTVCFECKEGPFVSHEEDGILKVKSEE